MYCAPLAPPILWLCSSVFLNCKMNKVLVNVSDILYVLLNIASILKELVGFFFTVEFEVGPLR
jgi:hypothetical protein